MAQGRELELKFAVGGEDLGKLLAHPLIAAAGTPEAPARLNATYFDTPDHDLWRRGISLRVRDADGRRTQTLKRAGPSAIDRGEWEAETDGTVPSLAWLAETPLRRAFRPRIGEALAPAFTVEVERTTFSLAQGSAEIEAAVDRGAIRAGGRSVPVHEVELELKRGEAADLFRLARTLVADVALVPSLASKAERGYRLLGGDGFAPTAALAPATPVAEAAETVVQACLHDLLLAIEAVQAGGDEVEAVHGSRVALRRLRAAMTLFEPVLADDGFARLDRDLRWMSGLLGAARDLDVMQGDLFDPAAEDPDLLGGHELAEHMRAKGRDARAALAAAFASPRWRCAVNELIAWLADGAWRGGDAAAGRLGSFVGRRLRKRRRRVVAMGAGLEAATPPERHRLRIQAKKLRYALAFFEDLPGLGKGSKDYRALQDGLERLQDALGVLHDREARRDRLRAEAFAWQGSAGAADERATFAAGVLAAAAPDPADLMAAAAKAFRKVRRHDPF